MDKAKSELKDLVSDLEAAAREAAVELEIAGLAPSIAPDEPITFSAQDRLNRAGFARQMARAILKLNAADSVVIGIYGPWGTGKTSLLNLIEEQLQAQSTGAPLIFRFNPWGFSDQEQLVAQFFAQLAAFLRVHITLPRLAQVSVTVEEYGALLNPIARLVAPRTTEAHRVSWSLFRRFRPRQQRTAVELKAEISSALRQAEIKLIIMLDDIDRLNQVEIRQAFQLVKLNANFSNTVYVVAFDKSPVQRALQEVAPGPPEEYLEKIIQVAFNLPAIGESTLTEMILADFNEVIGEFGIKDLDTQRFGNMFHSGFRQSFETPRHVTRYFNLFRFALSLMKDDIDFVDLAALQALSLYYPDLYRAIGRNEDLFSGTWSSLDKGHEKLANERCDAIFDMVSGSRREAVRSLCTFLFPKLESFYGNLKMNYGPDWEANWTKAKRVASRKYFAFYFQLAVPENEVSQREVDGAVDAANSVESFVEELTRFKRSGRFAAFVDLLRNSLDRLSPDRLVTILQSIFIFGDQVSTEGSDFFGVISEHLRFATWLLWDVVDRLGPHRFEILTEAMRGGRAVFTIVSTAFRCEEILIGDTRTASQREKYPDLTHEVAAEMRSIAVAAIAQAAGDGRLKSAPGLPFLLYRWKQWGDVESLNKWIESTFMSDPENAARFVAHFAQSVSSMGLSDKVRRVGMSVALKPISEFVDLTRLADLLRSAPDDKLTDKERAAKDRFLSQKAKIDAGAGLETVDMWPPEDDGS